jgi:hypothetical protein
MDFRVHHRGCRIGHTLFRRLIDRKYEAGVLRFREDPVLTSVSGEAFPPPCPRTVHGCQDHLGRAYIDCEAVQWSDTSLEVRKAADSTITQRVADVGRKSEDFLRHDRTVAIRTDTSRGRPWLANCHGGLKLRHET